MQPDLLGSYSSRFSLCLCRKLLLILPVWGFAVHAAAEINTNTLFEATVTDKLSDEPEFVAYPESDSDTQIGYGSASAAGDLNSPFQAHQFSTEAFVTKNAFGRPIKMGASRTHEFDLRGIDESHLWWKVDALIHSSSTFRDEIGFVARDATLPPLLTALYFFDMNGVNTQIIDIADGQTPLYRLEDSIQFDASAGGSEGAPIDFDLTVYDPHTSPPVTTEYSMLEEDVNIINKSLIPSGEGIQILQVDLQRVFEFGNIVAYLASLEASLVVESRHKFLNDGAALNYYLRGETDFSFSNSVDLIGILLRDETGAIRTDVDVTSTEGVVYPLLESPPVGPPTPPGKRILSPVAVVGTDLGTFSGETPLENTINQSGLDKSFVSGQTVFDDYFFTGDPPFAQANYQNNWQSEIEFNLPLTGSIEFDLGEVQSIDRLAVWNRSLETITVLVAETLDGPWQEVGDFALQNKQTFPFSYEAEILDFEGVYDGRFLRIEVNSAYPITPNDTFGYAILGEIAASVGASIPLLGDFNQNGILDAADIDMLTSVIRDESHNPDYDLNLDGQVDGQDLTEWVRDVKNTYLGDANLDGEFDTSDFVDVLAAGQYEDGQSGNSTWTTGDWNGDTEFDTSDLVAALQDGGYEQGPRSGVIAVPEPSTFCLAFFAVALLLLTRLQGSARAGAI